MIIKRLFLQQQLESAIMKKDKTDDKRSFLKLKSIITGILKKINGTIDNPRTKA